MRQQWHTVDLSHIPSRSRIFHAEAAGVAAAAAAEGARRRRRHRRNAKEEKATNVERRDALGAEAGTPKQQLLPRRSSEHVMKMRLHDVLKQQRNVLMLRA